MRRIGLLLGVALFAGCGPEPDESVGSSTSGLDHTTGPATCTVTGRGTLESDPRSAFNGDVTLVAVTGGYAGSGRWMHAALFSGTGNAAASPHPFPLNGVPEEGSCAINGSALADITGSGTMGTVPITFELQLTESILFGDRYELTVRDAASGAVLYYVYACGLDGFGEFPSDCSKNGVDGVLMTGEITITGT